MLLTDRQISKFRQAFGNNSSANIKISKTQLSQIVQSGGFLGRLIRPLPKTGLSSMKNVLKSFSKSVLISLGLAAAAAAIAGIHTFLDQRQQHWQS